MSRKQSHIKKIEAKAKLSKDKQSMNEEPMLVDNNNIKGQGKYMNKNPHFLVFGNAAPQSHSFIAIEDGNLHKAFEVVTSVRDSDRNRANLESHIPTINFASTSM